MSSGSTGTDARRVRKENLSDDQALITMALATRGTNFCKPDVVQFEWELAKELGLNITVHVAMDRFGYTKMHCGALKDMGLLYPNTTYIHSSHLLDDEWQMVADSGGNVSLAPQIELQMGHGGRRRPGRERWESRSDCRPTWRRPLRPTSSPRCTRSSPPSERAVTRTRGTRTPPTTSRHADLINRVRSSRWATLEGAKVAGIGDRSSSLTPGKKADLVIIDTKAVNVAPVIDPVGAIVCAADISNVRTVIVDGGSSRTTSGSWPTSTHRAGRGGVARLPRVEFGAPEPGWLPTAVTA